MSRNRFVGMASFTEKDNDIFFGRDQDIDRLSTLIQVERLVVMFSKSGLGKTSLLKAGVEPYLRTKHYAPVRVRFFNYDKNQPSYVSPTQVLENALGEWREGTFLDGLIPAAFRNTTWARLKLMQVREPQNTCLLMFDQFEELSTHPQEEIIWFKFQLADILQTKLPKIIEKHLAKVPHLTPQQTALLYAPLNVRIIISMRADFLSFLQQFRDAIPFVMSRTYELAPLNAYSAKEALLKPAQKAGKDFSTPPFAIHEEAFDRILQDLTAGNAGKTVESFQLQMVGSEMERIVMDKRAQTPEYQTVLPQDLPNLQNLWGQFYEKSINALPAEHQPQAQRLIEEYLVQQDRRISLDEVICAQILPHAGSLKMLVDCRLLRIEPNNRNGFSYEVSHDTLIKPIMEKLQKRRTAQKEALLQTQLAEAKAKAEAERQEAEKRAKEARHNRWLFYMAMGGLGVSLLAGMVSIYFYLLFRAERTRSEAALLRKQELLVQKQRETQKRLKEVEHTLEIEERARAAWESEKRAKLEAEEARLAQQKTQQDLTLTRQMQAIREAKDAENYGDSYANLGKMDFACESYQKALQKLQNYPNTPEYQKLAKKLRELCNK